MISSRLFVPNFVLGWKILAWTQNMLFKLQSRKTQILTIANMFFNNLVGLFSNKALFNRNTFSSSPSQSQSSTSWLACSQKMGSIATASPHHQQLFTFWTWITIGILSLAIFSTDQIIINEWQNETKWLLYLFWLMILRQVSFNILCGYSSIIIQPS